jgi:hypothetical protein
MIQGRAKADLITGMVLFVLAVAIVYGAWTMDRLELRQIHPLSAPGLLPGLLGIALGIFSLLLIAQALRARADASAVDTGPSGLIDDGGLVRLTVAAFLCLAYALGLVGRVPFWLATSVFVASFIFLFEWREASFRREVIASAGWALAIGIAVGWGVAYAFSELFLVRLP